MREKRSAGFVITLELLLVMVVLVIPLTVGLFLLGRKLVTLYLNQRAFIDMPASKAVVWDSSMPPKVVGPVIGYDQFEAPRVVFRDSASGSGAVLGVRRDRFTSYGEVFYSNDTCTENPYIRAWDAPQDANVATGFSPGGVPTVRVYVGPLDAYHPIGFLYQLQGRSYAMGSGNILYGSSVTPGVSITSTNLPVYDPILGQGPLYVWKSQDITPEDSTTTAPLIGVTPPCFQVPLTVEVTNLVIAEFVIQFEGAPNYIIEPGGFRAAFPSPGPAVPLTCGFNECP